MRGLIGYGRRRPGVSVCCGLLLILCALQVSVHAQATSGVEVMGGFSRITHTKEDAYGYALELWKQGNRHFGMLLVYTGAPSDPPTGVLEDVKFDRRTRRLSFSARLSTGVIYSREYSGVPSRDRFRFEGVVSRTHVVGTLTHSDDLFPNEPPTSKQITLRRSKSITELMVPPPPTYSAWETWADEILQRRGPKW